MLGDGRLPEMQADDDVADGPLLLREVGKNLPPARLGHGIECVGSGSSAGHEMDYIYPYGNMSIKKLLPVSASYALSEAVQGDHASEK